jgi:hypothetical protein
MEDRVRDAERQRLAAHARASRSGARRPPARFWWRLREAAGYRLVRTGMRLLDTGRA